MIQVHLSLPPKIILRKARTSNQKCLNLMVRNRTNLVWELIFFFLWRTFCPRLGRVFFFFVIVFLTTFRPNFTSGLLQVTSDRNAESCNRIPSNYCLPFYCTTFWEKQGKNYQDEDKKSAVKKNNSQIKKPHLKRIPNKDKFGLSCPVTLRKEWNKWVDENIDEFQKL